MAADILTVPTLIEVAAVTGGAISGALHAKTRRMDLLGIGFVAICTGVGGGAIRDVLLGNAVPIFLLQNYVLMAAIGAVAGYFFGRLVSELEPAIYVLDTLLIGAWVVIGAEKALALGLSNSAAVFLGITTAIGGGLLRDVLCRNVPTALMPGQWVAAAALVAAVLFVSIEYFTDLRTVAEGAAIVSAAALRLLSARFNWVTPDAVDASARLRRWLGLDRRAAAPVRQWP